MWGIFMRKQKGKRKQYLYIKRNREKIFRNKHIDKQRNINQQKCANYAEGSSLASEYNLVIQHLRKKKFALRNTGWQSGEIRRIEIPEVFAMSEDAECAIAFLRKIYTLCKNTKIRKIIFDHSKCKILGLSASTIMDVIVLAVAKYRDILNKPLEMEGIYPNNKTVCDILAASGLPHHLNADSDIQYDVGKVEPFETIHGFHDEVCNKADTTATQLTQYFDKCLKTQNMELKDEGKRILSRILGEVLSNCEIHGGASSTWYTQGHYQIELDKQYGEMQLLFLNIGETIYEGLKNYSTSSETKEKLNYIVSKHRKLMNKCWDEEMIYTVCALQEGISRLRDAQIEGYSGRGSGTVSMIEMFNDIGASNTGLKPQMTIVSGKTQIIFSDEYKMQPVEFDNDKAFGSGEKQIIAFNKQNDIYRPADTKNVRKLEQYFPGTVISLKFYLDSRYIAKRKENR